MTGKSPSKSAGGDYTVGYGKPPVEHRIKPGETRNPYGRAGKPRGPAVYNFLDVKVDGSDERLKQIVREEAYRMVRVKDGDGRQDMPAIQALVRQYMNQGLGGNRIVAKEIVGLVKGMEADALAMEMELHRRWSDLKIGNMELHIEAKRRGLPPPEVYPHPDDIVSDPRTGMLKVVGPMCRADREMFDECVAHRDQLIDAIQKEAANDLTLGADAQRQDRINYLNKLHRLLGVANDLLPPSLKRTIP